MLIGYARVSRQDGQDTAVQIEALKKAGVDRIFEPTFRTLSVTLNYLTPKALVVQEYVVFSSSEPVTPY